MLWVIAMVHNSKYTHTHTHIHTHTHTIMGVVICMTIAHVTNESDIVRVHPSWDGEVGVNTPIYNI